MKFQGDLLRSKNEFRDPRGDFDIPEEPSEISRSQKALPEFLRS